MSKPTFPSDMEVEELMKARTKATRIACMAWAEAKSCREFLRNMTELEIKPLRECIRDLRGSAQFLQNTFRDLNAKLLGGNDFEVTNNRLKNALIALERLVEGKVQMIQNERESTDGERS